MDNLRRVFIAFFFLICLPCMADVQIADITTNENWNGMPDFVQSPDTWPWSVSTSFFFWMGVGIASGCAFYGLIVKAFKTITDTNVD